MIPESVYCRTFRTMDEAWRKEVKTKISDIINTVCVKYNTKADINIIDGYPF